MSQAPIEFRGLSKSYKFGFWGRKQQAVSNLTLSVPANSIYGFLGANGAGKTTCIKILMGLQFASGGEVKLFGRDPLDPAAKMRVGYLPERPYFHDSMSAAGFLDFHRRLFGALGAGRRPLANGELLALVGLADVQDKPLRDFSKGMLQRIGIAQALVNDPDLVVLDEPMSGLDPVGRREVRDLILRLHDLGKTVFFSSHILSDVEGICQRIAFLEKGVLRHEGSLSEIHRPEGAVLEVAFAGIAEGARASSALLSGAAARGEGHMLRCESPEVAQDAVREVWRLKGNLLSYQREHRTLEDFLFGGAPR